MWPAQEAADWELSKENVQPLRQGRRVAALSTSLQTGGDEAGAQKVAEQRRAFELEIRTYSGEDPLLPWHQYVLWMEQHCPRGGHEGNLDRLLEQCISKFSQDVRYHQDPRYVSLWIKLACNSQQTHEIFQYMLRQNIGTSLTMFYTAWASQHELSGNVLRADTVLAEGEGRGAQPAEALAEARRKLQVRVASALAAGQLHTPPVVRPGPEEERRALGVLKDCGDGEVARSRVGPALAGRPGTLATAAPPPGHANTRLNVYVDENGAPQPPPAASAAAAAGRQLLPTARTVNKENVRNAGPWGAPAASARRAPPPPAAAPAFRVFEEAGAARGGPVTANPGALAARAAPAPARPDAEWNPPVALFEPPSDSVKPMYCKDVIYAGAGEVSFEELRAARWKKENKMLQVAEHLMRQMEEVMRKNELLERQLQELKTRAPTASQQQQQQQPVQQQPQQQQQQQQQPVQQQQGSFSLSAHLGSSNISGGSSSLAGHNSNLSSSTVAASPTVNTRDAMNYVREILNKTVDTSVVQLSRQSGSGGRGAGPVPFTVYEEPEPAAAAPFAVYEDEAACGRPPADGKEKEEPDSDQENRPPAGCPPPPARRRPAGCLVDATDVPLPAGEPARRPLQFDDELTGFVPLSDDVSFADADLAQFAAAAGRAASTPFVPPPPPAAAGAARARRGDDEPGELTASLKSVRVSRPSGDRVSPPQDGAGLTPIMERSQEQYKSSSSSSGSDMSRQSRGDLSVPASGQRWPPGGRRGSAVGRGAPPPLLTHSSGYLGDRSASALARPAADVSMARRPDPADVSDVQAPDVSMAPPDVSAAAPAELSCRLPAGELSLVPPPALSPPPPPPPADVSPVQPPTDISAVQPPAELSAIQPPAELSAVQPPADVSAVQPPAELSSAQRPDEPATALAALSLSEHPDPWDEQLITALLRRLGRPVHARQRYVRVESKLPNFGQKEVDIGGVRFSVTLIGEGAYARVYHALERDTGRALCLKVQPAGGDWEFYVVDELRDRLARRGDDQPGYLMSVDTAVMYDNGSVLVTEYEAAGSLLDVHNRLRQATGRFAEPLAMLFTAEMLASLEAVHAVGVIHGDVKPDNFLLRTSALQNVDHLMAELKEAGPPRLLQLIDFGRAIDTVLLPPGTTFTRVVTTDGFTCPEMRDGRPWTFQTDLFGLAASAYVLLFGSYPELKQSAGEPACWTFSGTIRRYWCVELWSDFFAAFLNIRSCSELPDLAGWRRRFLERALAAKDMRGCLTALAARAKAR